MTNLPTLHPGANAAVIGASGGIGGAICRLLENDPRVARMFAFSRSNDVMAGAGTTCAAIDLADENSIVAAGELAAADSPLDLVFVATGILHRGDRIRPEKSFRDLDPRVFAEVLGVNTIGPALVAKHFLPLLRRDHKTVFAALSARVGSIGDNRLGGWTSYRASKAALNMVLKTFAIEQSRTRPQSIVAALHPGTVDTGLSKPFTTRVPESRLFTPEKAAAQLLAVIDGLAPEDSGGFFAWDGSRVAF